MIDYSTSSFYGNNGSSDPTGLAKGMQDELTMTMRSVRDTMAISFQTLNLTLSSMNNTLRTMTTAINPANMPGAGRNYMPSSPTTYSPGAMSTPMAQMLGSSSFIDLYTQPKPFNVSSNEYAYNLQQERGYRLANMGIQAVGTAANIGLSGVAATQIARGATSMLSRAPMVGPAMGRMLGTGMGRLGMSMAVGFPIAGMAMDQLTGSVTDAADQHIRDVGGIRRLSTRFGNEFSNRQAGTVARGINSLALHELMNTTDMDTRLGASGYRQLTMQGMENGLFHGKGPEDMVNQLKKAASVVKLLTGVMNSKDVGEAISSLSQFKGMGMNMISNTGYAHNLANSAMRYGGVTGMGAAGMMQAGMVGSQAYSQFGHPSYMGVLPMMQNMAIASEFEKRGRLSAAEMAVGGGVNGVARNMTTAMGGILASPQMGDVLLAASMNQGGQFSAGQMGQGFGKGYFGMVGQGASNILGNPAQMAKFMVNKTNMMGQLGASGLDSKATIQMMRSALDNMPYMQGLSYKDKEPMTQAYVKQMLGQMGLPADDATAKAMAARVLHPNAIGNIDREGNRMIARGAYADIRERSGVFRSFGRFGEGLYRIKDYVGEKSTRRLGRYLADEGIDLFDSEASATSPIGAGRATGQSFANFMGSRDPNTRRRSGGRYSADEISSAFAQANNDYNGNDGDLGGSARMNGFGSVSGGGIANFLSGRKLKAYAVADMYSANKDYYKKLQNSDGFDGLAAFGVAGKDFLGAGANYRDYVEGFGDFKDKQMGGSIFKNKEDVIASGLQYAYSATMKSNPNAMTAGKDKLLNSKGYQKFSTNFDNIKGQIADAIGLNGDLRGLSREDMMTKIAATPELASLASQHGMSLKQLAYSTAEQTHGSGGTSGWMNSFALGGSDATKFDALGLAAQVPNKTEADVRAFQMTDAGLRFGDSQVSSLRSLGLDDNILDTLANSKDARGDSDAFGSALGMLAAGQDASGVAKGIKNKDLRKAFASMAMKSPDEIQKYLHNFDRSNGTDSWESMGRDAVNSALNKKLDATSADQLDFLFGGAGSDIHKAFGENDIDGAMRKITGMSSDDAQVQGIQGTIMDMYKARSGGHEAYKGVAEAQGLEWDKIKGLDNKDIEKQILGSALASSESAKEDYNKQAARDGKDIRDAMTSEGDAIRVVIKTDGAGAAKDEGTKRTRDTNVLQVDQSKNAGQTIGGGLQGDGSVTNFGNKVNNASGSSGSWWSKLGL